LTWAATAAVCSGVSLSFNPFIFPFPSVMIASIALAVVAS
jgi:hypothetical protein